MLRRRAASSMSVDFSCIVIMMRGGSVKPPPRSFHPSVGLLFFLIRTVEDQVDDNSEDQGAGDLGQCNGTDAELHAADTRNQDHGSGEEIPVIIQVNRLEHLETGYSNKAVQGDADTAHDAAGDRAQEGDEGSEEAGSDGQDRGGEDGDDGSVAGDGYAAD